MRVLVVDDHALVRDGLRLLLPALDPQCSAIGVGSCEEAFALLQTDRSAFELVLLDLGLPGLCGSDGIAAMRARFPDLPVVVLSGDEDPSTVIHAIRSGAVGYIPKSYSGDRLLGALRFILVNKGVYLPAELLVDAVRPVFDRPADQGADSLGTGGTTSPRDLGLTPRQAAVLRLVLQGKSNKAIARALSIEDTTVRSHVTAVLRSLNAATRTEAVVAAHRLGLSFPENA